MASTKLASTFIAWRTTIGADPSNLGDALKRCKELGLIPKVCGYQGKKVLFSIMLPKSGHQTVVHPRNFVEDYMGEFKGTVLMAAGEVELICPA